MSITNKKNPDTVTQRPRYRKLLFRLLAILIGLTPFLLCEAALRVGGWQSTDAVHDPFVGFTEILPLFQSNSDGTHYEVSPSRLPLFRPDSFLIKKPANEFRIFCIGGSTVQGRPFAIETAFSSWLEMNLAVTDPSKDWQVINCGGVSYASYRLAPIMDEIVNYEPDLIVLYTGHNEFLEDRTYRTIRETPAWVAHPHAYLSRLRTYSFLRRWIVGDDSTPKSENTLPSDVEARLDFKNGMEQYTRDRQWKQDVVLHFESNFRRMISTAQAANVPIIVCKPTCNLRDSPPFKSENSETLSQYSLERFETWKSELETETNPPRTRESARSILQTMLDCDREHAMTHFRFATLCLADGDIDLAREHFLEAKEQDICPLRATEPIYQAIARVTRETDSPTVDIQAAFAKRASDGIAGGETLIDHVHPTIHGHQLIAGMLVHQMQIMGLVENVQSESRDAEVGKQYTKHLEKLPLKYFANGKDRLAGLKRWAAGEVTRERSPKNANVKNPELHHSDQESSD